VTANKEFVYICAAEQAIINYCKDAVNLERILLQDNPIISIRGEIAELTVHKDTLQRKVDNLINVLTEITEKPTAIVKQINTLIT
jgi:hypothetical protein